MFSKIYVSLFVFCLFNLGQAAPVIDEISLSTRELPSLDARGFFGLFHKPDTATQKLIDNVSVTAQCQTYLISVHTQKAYSTAHKTLKKEMDASKEKKKAVKKEYQKRVKNLEHLEKKAEKEVKKLGHNLKKLSYDVAKCKSQSTTSHSDSDSD